MRDGWRDGLRRCVPPEEVVVSAFTFCPVAERDTGVTEGFHVSGTARKVMLRICCCPCQFRGGVSNEDEVMSPKAPLMIAFFERLYNVDVGKAVTVDVKNGKRHR